MKISMGKRGQGSAVAPRGFRAMLMALALSPLLFSCAPHPQKSVAIIAGGDCLLDRYDGALARVSERDERWDELRAASRGADAFLFNLETTVGTSGSPKSKRFVFSAPPAALAPLGGFPRPVAALANNHSLDYGPARLAETIEALDRAGISRAGAGKTCEEAGEPAVIEARGAKIRILSFGFDDDPSSYSDEEGGCIAPLNLPRMKQSVAAARGTDLLVIMLHWGVEYERRHNARQSEIARALIDAGADAILGDGPHVLQGLEIYKGSLICYSLGNLVFDDLGGEETTASILVRISHTRQGGRVNKSFEILPLRTRDIYHGPSRASDADAKSILREIAKRSPDPSILSQKQHRTDDGFTWYRIGK